MAEPFATLQAFMVHTKSVAYLLMAGGLIGLPLWWLFITGRDEKKRTW